MMKQDNAPGDTPAHPTNSNETAGRPATRIMELVRRIRQGPPLSLTELALAEAALERRKPRRLKALAMAAAGKEPQPAAASRRGQLSRWSAIKAEALARKGTCLFLRSRDLFADSVATARLAVTPASTSAIARP